MVEGGCSLCFNHESFVSCDIFRQRGRHKFKCNSSFELDVRGQKANLFYNNDKNITCLMADEWNDEIVRLLKEMIEKLEGE